ncbi:MAG TPA: YegS/Rv2252/BmrU family lipid kinase [Acidimicrobiales bacterium]|nr:YegS/Rv2252/BmrU family lipid kinase [Acidimicrobiales bacterium]
MEYVVVGSSKAGSEGGQQLEAVTGVLAGHGKTQLVRCSGAEDLDRALDGLDDRTLVIAGGDGSLHFAVQRLWDRGELGKVIMGLVPLGTGNDFARGLGLPLDPLEAAAVAAAVEPRRLDVVVGDDGGVVVNVAHAGLGARAAEDAKALKARLGPVAYPVGALIAAVRDKGWRLEVSVDGKPVGGDAELMVGVGNGKTIGGGTPLCPDAAPDDGLLDVVVVNATGAAARVAFAAALRTGRHLQRGDVHHVRGREVSISGDAVAHNVDGEVSDEVEERSYRVVPSAWSLLTP